MAASTVKQWVFRQFKEGMKKNNKGHQKTLERQMFPQGFPQGKNGGETNQNSKCDVTPMGTWFMTQIEESPQPSLDEIWEWLGNPDAE